MATSHFKEGKLPQRFASYQQWFCIEIVTIFDPDVAIFVKREKSWYISIFLVLLEDESRIIIAQGNLIYQSQTTIISYGLVYSIPLKCNIALWTKLRSRKWVAAIRVSLIVLPDGYGSFSDSQLGSQSYIALYRDAVYLHLRKLKFHREFFLF